MIGIAASLVFIVSFLIYIIIRTSTPEMAPLFSQMEPGDGGKILEKLKAMNIPTELKGDGTLIMVPADEVAHLRMTLAQEGLPAGGNSGYELFDHNDMLGTTSAMLDINRVRALEGELSKSVRTIQGVQAARIHLVLPKRELFSHDKQQPGASVVLKMKGSARLSASQIQAVQHLVASAVPNLTTDKISIIDDKGTLLAKGHDRTESTGDSFSLQNEMRQGYEERLSRIIESLLDRTLGFGKSRAETSVEMDFDRITSTTVEYDPNGQVARSTTNTEEGNNANEAAGGDNISIQSSLPENNSQAGGGAQSKTLANRTEENTTFEISNTTKTHVKEVGTVKRLSIAVLVDGTYDNNQFTARSQQEIDQITAIIKNAVGFKEDRGDKITVASMKFAEVSAEKEVFNWLDWLKTVNINKVIEISLLSLFGFVIIFFVIRPFLKNVLDRSVVLGRHTAFSDASGQSSSGSRYRQLENDEQDESNEQEEEEGEEYSFSKKKSKLESFLNTGVDGKSKENSAKKLKEIVEKHPEEAVSILRTWMYGDT